MTKSKIVDEELTDHWKRTSMELLFTQRERRGPVSHMVNQQRTQVWHTIILISSPFTRLWRSWTLHHKAINPSEVKGRDYCSEPRSRPYYTYHWIYSHGTNGFMSKLQYVELINVVRTEGMFTTYKGIHPHLGMINSLGETRRGNISGRFS